MRTLFCLAAFISVAACATPYRVPVEEAPKAWRHDNEPIGLAVMPETGQTFTGTMQRKDVIVQVDLFNERTGTVQNELVWTSRLGGEERIPAGSPAYARQFSLVSTRTRYSMPIGLGTNLNELNNPIEWCVPRGKEAVCIFWQGNDQALYIDSVGGLASNAKPTSTKGQPGTLPIIVENTDAPEPTLTLKGYISRLNEREARISFRLYEGEEWDSFGTARRVKWEDGLSQEVTILDGRFKISAIKEEDGDINAVNVELVRAPQTYRGVSFSELAAALKALSIINALGAENEGADEPGAEAEQLDEPVHESAD